MNILYIGSSGPLSVVPLRALLQSGATVCALAVEQAGVNDAAGRAGPPVISADPESLESLALHNDIPLLRLAQDWSRNLRLLRDCAPDLILVSCFARKLPDSVLAIPALGCFNLHPSLLPAYRGPVPLFWQFRHGVQQFGITLHRMTSLLDAGEIVAQSGVEMPCGISYQAACRLLAQAGSELLARDNWVGQAQDESRTSYYGFPQPADFAVSTGWPATRLYNFICATRDWKCVYPCEIAGRIYRLVDVDACRALGAATLCIEGDRITLPCNPGSVRARFESG